VDALGYGEPMDVWTGKPREVDALVGCALLLRTEALLQVGLIDEDYFLYMEESDWCTRARRAGWKCLLVPDSKVWHAESLLSGEAKSFYSAYYFARNRLWFTWKNHPRNIGLALLWSMRHGIMNNLVRRRWPQLWLSLLGIWDFIKGRKGPRDGLPGIRGSLPGTLVFSVDYKPQPGGIAEHAYKVAWHLAQLGGSVVVVGPRCRDSERFDEQQAFPTYRIPRIPVVDWLIYAVVMVYAILRHRVGLVYCATSHPCAVICILVRALVFFRFTVTIHGHEVVYTTRGVRALLKSLVRPLQIGALGMAYRVFAVSNFTKRSLVKAGIDEAKIAVIMNGVDLEDFEDSTPLPRILTRYGLDGKRIILTVARLDVHKGHDVVLKAMPEILKLVPDAVYVIAGDGSMREHLQKLSRRLGVYDRVVFTGHLRRSDLIALYKVCDVFVMASRIQDGNAEGFGIAFIEAGAMGKPVVGGRSGGIPDAVADGLSGLLVDPEDPAAVAEAIARIMLEPQLAERLSRQGYRRVLDGFTWDHVVNRIIEALNAGVERR
jgi:phosphatidylinositol alpha-1,6-mannosyltransferase